MDILFDIGNVIVGVDFLPALKRLIPGGASDAGDELNALLERKDEFEAGRVSADEYFPWAAETIGFTGTREELLRAWLDIFTPNQAMWDDIDRLRAGGHRLILFSNINNPHKTHLLETYPVFRQFAGGVYSFETGHIKPEPEIYQLAISRWNLDPANTLYIDDLAANIEAGKKAGFLCHQYRIDRHAAFVSWLEERI